MAKVLIFNFDGTGNEPEDAVQEVKDSGEFEDESITNVLKFHLLLGGALKKGENQALPGGNRTFYYNGVGTYGNFFERLLNKGLAFEKWDVAKIINLAMADFDNYYEDENFDKVLVTGFSRGAAIARRFASLINGKVKDNGIIEAVFDTVASIGMPDMNSADRPSSDVVFEHGCTLPDNVEKALHLVSLDDKRRAFQPTLMNHEEKVREVWFPGGHSDVGGGFYYDGLSDNAMHFFLDWILDLGLGIELKRADQIDYGNILDTTRKFIIGQDDVQVDPDPLGIMHQQKRGPISSLITLTDRRCCVIENDRIKEDARPLVHWSVAERLASDRNYKPKSLKNIPHEILTKTGDIIEKTGFTDHRPQKS